MQERDFSVFDKNATRKTTNYQRKRRKRLTEKEKDAIKPLAKIMVSQLAAGETMDAMTAGKKLWFTPKSIRKMTQTKKFLDVLDEYGVTDERIAALFSDKLEEHAALPAGKDDGMFKILDMIMRSKGLYKAEQKTIDEEPESIRMIKDALSGIYISENNSQEWQDTNSDN